MKQGSEVNVNCFNESKKYLIQLDFEALPFLNSHLPDANYNTMVKTLNNSNIVTVAEPTILIVPLELLASTVNLIPPNRHHQPKALHAHKGPAPIAEVP